MARGARCPVCIPGAPVGDASAEAQAQASPPPRNSRATSSPFGEEMRAIEQDLRDLRAAEGGPADTPEA
jgi:hypothetical protein